MEKEKSELGVINNTSNKGSLSYNPLFKSRSYVRVVIGMVIGDEIEKALNFYFASETAKQNIIITESLYSKTLNEFSIWSPMNDQPTA